MWDSEEHPTFIEGLHKMLGFERKYLHTFSQMFYDYLGGNEIEERVEKLMSKYGTWTDIIGCGSYNFRFVLDWTDIEYEESTIYIGARYDKNGTVINPDGETITLYDAVRDDEYGFEYVLEIQDCITEKINEEFLSETGLYVSVEI